MYHKISSIHFFGADSLRGDRHSDTQKYGSRSKTLGFLFGNKSISALGIWVGVQQLHIGETIATWFYQTSYEQPLLQTPLHSRSMFSFSSLDRCILREK
ncbi:MAG: hypothetical protein WBP64_06180 [Nitrososphaeraceae archaeon]